MAQADRQNGIVADMAFGSSTVSSPPTVAQIDALTRIETALVDGPTMPRSGNTFDVAALADRESSMKAGSIENGNIGVTAYREFDGTDTYWALFAEDADTPTNQTLVMCRRGFNNGGDGTVTAGDIVDVYTVQVVKREPLAPVKDDAQRFNVELAVVSPAFDVVVAA